MRHDAEFTRRLPRNSRGMRSQVSPAKKAFARRLRLNPTTAFDLLWNRLRRNATGYRFRRRAVLYGWILDFWSPKIRVAVEIDYLSDASQLLEHRRRDKVLTLRAITILRFPAERVYFETDQVVREIKAVIEAGGNGDA
jgi:very-short-patch-repair endonuclease